jgi:hypothetical protein
MTVGDGETPPVGGETLTARCTAQRLARAFDRHLDREDFADCARVVVMDRCQGRYEYVDGVHYVTDVEDSARNRLERFVRERGLETVMDGASGYAFQHRTPAPGPDAHVAGAVVKTVFDACYTDLTNVVEVLDARTHVSWTDPTEQRA